MVLSYFWLLKICTTHAYTFLTFIYLNHQNAQFKLQSQEMFVWGGGVASIIPLIHGWAWHNIGTIISNISNFLLSTYVTF